MPARLLYNPEDLEDVLIVLKFIDSYTRGLGIKYVDLDTAKIQGIVGSCRKDFPHTGGIEHSSAFKQVANFLCFFVAEAPILEPFPVEIIGTRLAKIDNHQNAIVAFALAEAALRDSKIKRKDGEFIVKNPIQYSAHSYGDIIEALAKVTPYGHFKLVTVLLEQLVYKTNPDCQYPLISGG